MVEREIEELGSAGELVLPVGELRGQGLNLQPGALPYREVGVLHRQLGGHQAIEEP